jgi:hypothetical protein
MRTRALGEAAGIGMMAAAFARKYTDEVALDTKSPKYTQEEIGMGYAVLMTGPKATPPRWKTVRRIIYQIRHGIDIKGRRVVRFDAKSGKTLTLHPTKGLRNVA